MRVQFEYTIDDMVDVQLRVLKRSRAARSWQWRDLGMTSLLTGAVLFAVIPKGFAGRAIMGGIGLLLGALLYPIMNERTVRRRLRKFCQEKAGSSKTLFCEVEVRDSGVHTRSNGTQIIYPWDKVTEIEETDESVDLYTEVGGLLVVRKRAFASPEEQQKFVELANRYVKVAHPGSEAKHVS